MAHKKEPTWITAKKAADLLAKKTDRPINDRYIRRLATRGAIDSMEITSQQKLYSQEDVEKHIPSGRVGHSRSKQSAKQQATAV